MQPNLYLLFALVFILSCSEPVSQNQVGKRDEVKLVEPNELSGEDIMKLAHKHAGGDFWKRPKSLSLYGHGRFYNNGKMTIHEKHQMYRVYKPTKEAAHKANGKVRIESYHNGNPVFLVTFDGLNTYDLKSKRDPSMADAQWASNFGYGVIRHSLDPGYKLVRFADDWIDGNATYTIQVIDPNEGTTIFGIKQDDYKIVMVGFDTPRGWHERKYSNFFTKKEYSWQQAGLVRLYYNGIKSNEIIWEDFEVNASLPDSIFTIEYKERPVE